MKIARFWKSSSRTCLNGLEEKEPFMIRSSSEYQSAYQILIYRLLIAVACEILFK